MVRCTWVRKLYSLSKGFGDHNSSSRNKAHGLRELVKQGGGPGQRHCPPQSDQLAPLLEGRPSCPSICPSLASSPSFGGASGFIPLKLFISAKSPKKIAGGTGIIFKFNSDLLKQGVDLKFELLNQWFYVWIIYNGIRWDQFEFKANLLFCNHSFIF